MFLNTIELHRRYLSLHAEFITATGYSQHFFTKVKLSCLQIVIYTYMYTYTYVYTHVYV